MRRDMDKVQDESATKPDGIMREIVTAKDRVKKFRKKLKTEQCGRLEVWLPNNLIDAVRTIAKHENRYMWAIIKEAIWEHACRHAAIVNAPRTK